MLMLMLMLMLMPPPRPRRRHDHIQLASLSPKYRTQQRKFAGSGRNRATPAVWYATPVDDHVLGA
jgi:hypothetical protein